MEKRLFNLNWIYLYKIFVTMYSVPYTRSGTWKLLILHVVYSQVSNKRAGWIFFRKNKSKHRGQNIGNFINEHALLFDTWEYIKLLFVYVLTFRTIYCTQQSLSNWSWRTTKMFTRLIFAFCILLIINSAGASYRWSRNILSFLWNYSSYSADPKTNYETKRL